MWQKWRRNKFRAGPFRKEWRRFLHTTTPFYGRLSHEDRSELEGHVQVFLAEKPFEGCDGFKITDQVKLSIAAQACQLLLNREHDYFPTVRSVIVFPGGAFQATVTHHYGSGIVDEQSTLLEGQAWHEGFVLLAWDVVCQDASYPERGQNIVLHEFAHQIDCEDGSMNGAPVLGYKELRKVRKIFSSDWTRVMAQEFEQLRNKVQKGESSFLRSYAATDPAEFFAVATEVFFCKPGELQKTNPRLYNELGRFYRQNPADWPFHPSAGVAPGTSGHESPDSHLEFIFES